MVKTCPKCRTENPADSDYCKKCAAPLTGAGNEDRDKFTRTMETPREELKTGSTFAGRYQIIEELGSGGMGRVYKVLDTEIQEKVALKLISPELAAEENTITRFRNELKLARTISHPHVCRMFDLNREGATYFITMEYVSGQDLKGLIRQTRQLTIGTAVCIARQICDGLSAAHAKGIVHRDLKPNNIMMDRNGNVRIMDFGIARSPKSKGITGRGTMIGTPEYMSPEQVEGKEVDQRSDIYSLGIILYEMLAGRLPFEGETALDVGIKQKSEMPEDPVKHNPRIPADLSALILKCLEKVKEDRYQSAAEVESELVGIEECLSTAEKAVPLKKTSTSRSITVQFTPKKLLIPALALVVVLIAGYLLLKPRSGPGPVAIPADKPSLAVVYFENNSGKPDLDQWRSGLCELLITDLSQSRYLHVLSGDKIYGLLEQHGLLDRGKYSDEDLRKIAYQGGVQHILRGNYMTAGNTFIVNVSLLEAETGEVITSLKEEGTGEESLTGSVDKITRAVKAALNLTPQQMASDIDTEVGIVTTRSPEAYKHYVEGIRYDIRGNYPKVIESMKKAVAVDPEFASAYHVLSWAYGNQGYAAEQKEYLTKAMELSGRLSLREKYWIEGAYYLDVKADLTRAEEALLNLIDLYPDDISAHNHLGIVYRGLDDDDKAIHHYSRAIALGTKDAVIYTNLGAVYRGQGKLDKEREVLESYLQNVGDSARIHLYLARNYRDQGRYDKALDELDKAEALSPEYDPAIRFRGVTYIYTEEWDKAEAVFNRLKNAPDILNQNWGVFYFACLRQLQGRFKEMEDLNRQGLLQSEEAGQEAWSMGWLEDMAQSELNRGHYSKALPLFERIRTRAAAADEPGREMRAILGQGLVQVGLNDLETARKTAVDLKALVESSRIDYMMQTWYFLQGRIACAEKQYDHAIANFEKGRALLGYTSAGHIRFLNELGRTAALAGDWERTLREYTELTRLNVGRMDYGDIYAKAFYHLGRIHEELNSRDEAVQNYRKFLDLWKNADSGLPEVEDAKARLASLTGG